MNTRTSAGAAGAASVDAVGLPKHSRVQHYRPVPADFAAIAGSMKNDDLCRRYGVGKGYIARWRKQSGVPGMTGSYQPLAVPAGFANLAPTMTPYTAARHFGRGVEVVKRWAEEAGVRLRRPVSIVSRGTATPVRMESHRDMSRAGQAAEFLQKFGPVYRCDEQGRQLEDGFFWRRGLAVLTDAEIIERAERNGWDADAWKRCAA
jgi:hypothetical protein